MLSYVPYTELADELFEREWQRRLSPDGADRASASAGDSGLDQVDQRLAACVMRELVELLESRHDRPVDHLIPTIRLLILERDFIGAGDQSPDRSLQSRVDELVAFFVDVLEKVRRQAIERGAWSDLPATPQMFG